MYLIVWFSESSPRCKREVLLRGGVQGAEEGTAWPWVEGAQGKLQRGTAAG